MDGAGIIGNLKYCFFFRGANYIGKFSALRSPRASQPCIMYVNSFKSNALQSGPNRENLEQSVDLEVSYFQYLGRPRKLEHTKLGISGWISSGDNPLGTVEQELTCPSYLIILPYPSPTYHLPSPTPRLPLPSPPLYHSRTLFPDP